MMVLTRADGEKNKVGGEKSKLAGERKQGL